MANPSTIISAEVLPFPGEATTVARELQCLGFQVLSLDDTISVQGPRSLWTSTFRVQFETQSRPAVAGLLDQDESYQKALKGTLAIPRKFKKAIRDIAFVEPPELF